MTLFWQKLMKIGLNIISLYLKLVSKKTEVCLFQIAQLDVILILEMIIPLESLKQSMDKQVLKLVVYTDKDIMNMEMDDHVAIIEKAIKEKTFNHIELINPAKK